MDVREDRPLAEEERRELLWAMGICPDDENMVTGLQKDAQDCGCDYGEYLRFAVRVLSKKERKGILVKGPNHHGHGRWLHGDPDHGPRG